MIFEMKRMIFQVYLISKQSVFLSQSLKSSYMADLLLTSMLQIQPSLSQTLSTDARGNIHKSRTSQYPRHLRKGIEQIIHCVFHVSHYSD